MCVCVCVCNTHTHMQSKQLMEPWMELWINSKKRTMPCRIHKGLLIRRFFRCYAINTTCPTNPSMSNILNNVFSCRVEELTTKMPVASTTHEKQLINFECWNFFHEEGLCAKINAVF